MAKQSAHTMRFSYSPEVVFRAVTSPEFLTENFKAQGNPDAKVVERSRTDNTLVIFAEVTEFAKGVTGVDKSKTELTSTTYHWDVPGKKATWTYQSPHSQVKVWGAIRIEGAGQGATLHEEFNVEVKVPLLGGKIEKMILKEVDSFWARYERLVEDYCKRFA